jgi:hypothetical protein
LGDFVCLPVLRFTTVLGGYAHQRRDAAVGKVVRQRPPRQNGKTARRFWCFPATSAKIF